MIEFKQKNYYLSQIFGTLYYASLFTLIVLSGLELGKRGFVSYHFNLVWLLIFVLLCGTMYAIFKASPQRSGLFSKILFIFVLFGIFFIVGAQIKLEIINPYVLALLIATNFGLAWYLMRPSTKNE